MCLMKSGIKILQLEVRMGKLLEWVAKVDRFCYYPSINLYDVMVMVILLPWLAAVLTPWVWLSLIIWIPFSVRMQQRYWE